ncbi:MAG TPA: hypothetical protein VHF45_10180 [Thermoleophilaceae bacterium]|nr:hypothetical protein [Thermoleophilaceae bacterium]
MNSSSDRLLALVSLLIVLLVALYTSRTTTTGLGLAVALVGLVVAYYRPVLGIPVTLAMAVVAATVPWAVLLVIAFAALLMFATKAPDVASSRVDPIAGASAANGVSSGAAGGRDFGDFGW